MTYNPDYVPTGRNSRDNPYYMKINHVRIAKNASNRTEFFGGPSVADYIVDGTTPSLVLDNCGVFFGTRPLDATDYDVDGIGGVLILDNCNTFFGTGVA